jgi:hypothetical protein
MFKAGDKVVCVDASESTFLVCDKEYEVIRINDWIDVNGAMGSGVVLRGLNCPYRMERFELAEDKPKWEVGRWYPNIYSTDLLPLGTKYSVKYASGREWDGEITVPLWFDDSVIAFKVVAYPKKRVKKTVERWVNVYKDEDGLIRFGNCHFESEVLTHSVATPNRIASVKLTGEYEVDED